MNKRAAGISLIAIAAFLYSVRYIGAVIWGAGTTSWSSDLFANLINNTSVAPLYFSWIALAAGIVYLYQAETEEKQRKANTTIIATEEQADDIVNKDT